jgi:hypothetical protein
MNVPGNQSTGALSAASWAMAPSPTPRAPTQPGIPSAAEGLDAPLPSAPVMATPSPRNVLQSAGAAAAPQRPKVAKTLDEMKAGAMGAESPRPESVTHQGMAPETRR